MKVIFGILLIMLFMIVGCYSAGGYEGAFNHGIRR